METLADRAFAGQNEQARSDFRKLASLGLAVTLGGPAAVIAAQADRSVFQKTMEIAVGRGEMTADAAVENLIDRGACTLSGFLHKTIATAVNVGCRVAGGWVGHFFGPQGIVVGQKIGATVARVLNTSLSPLIHKGVEQVKKVARTAWQKTKSTVKKIVSKIKNFF